MERGKVGLDEIGKGLDVLLADATRPEQQIRAAREGLLDRVARGTAPVVSLLRRRPRRVVLPALGGLAAVAAALLVWTRVPISFVIGGTGVNAGTAAPIAAEKGESVPLSFSDGSSIVVRPGGQVRVLGTQATGAHVLLERGAVDVAITHRQRRNVSWSFEAGPLSVAVTGTRFRLAWSPRDQVFGLAISEGAVVVSGSCLKAPQTVRAGGNLELTCATPDAGAEHLALAPSADAPSGVEARTVSPEAAAVATGDVLGARADATPTASGAPAEKTWRELLREGASAQALSAAESADFAAVCRSASQAELIGLADAARLVGDTDKATSALGSLRRRFPGTANAAAAAFSLGRIAFERRGAYAEAVRWFSTYLSEAPNGPLMGDAVGRLMEARERQGDGAGARSDAEQYLRRFPRGPYAPLAKRLLQEQ